MYSNIIVDEIDRHWLESGLWRFKKRKRPDGTSVIAHFGEFARFNFQRR